MHIDKLEILRIASNDLANIEYKNVFRLVNELGLSNMISFNLPAGVYIFRLRPSIEKPFTQQTEISFNPKSNMFGRANKPNQPMFYGSFATPEMQSPVLTNTAEIIHVLTNGNHIIKGDSVEFTIGKWRLEKPLSVVPMIFNEKHLLKNEIFRPLYENYMKANKINPRNREIINFIAQEFAKTNIKSHLEYKITAAFTNLMFKNYVDKIEAIIYPSVRADGEGFNIALTPNFVSKYLKLHSVSTIRMYFKDGLGALDYEKITEKINNDGSFQLTPITEPGVTKGRDWCLGEIDRLNKK